MKKACILLLLVLVIIFPGLITAEECRETDSTMDATTLQEISKACQDKIAANKQEQSTLKQAITSINAKINLAQAQINQTVAQIKALEKEITVLSGVLDTVNISMEELGKIYLARVRESYRRSRVTSIDMIFSTSSFGDFLTKLKYLNTIKAKDQLILSELERSRLDYDQRKREKVSKQEKIENLKSKLLAQKKTLDNQQAEKQNLLILTQNDEKKFQALLSSARAELEAIEAIIAGNVDETEVGDVSSGQRIASIINGRSCNSEGAHLHFIVSQDGNVKNPFSYLKAVDFENCSGSSCGNSSGDPFNPSGSWDWPISPKIEFNQGYGSTWAVKNRWVGKIYSFHNGIDIKGSSLEVKAVQAGKLFRGSYTGSKGCVLKYVHLKHRDGGLDTFYLHVNYF